MNPVVHFEIPYENRERMAKFYESAFAWKLEVGNVRRRNGELCSGYDCYCRY